MTWGTEAELLSDLLSMVRVDHIDPPDVTKTYDLDPAAPTAHPLAAECGVNLYLAVCWLAMMDSFGDPESKRTIEAKKWCMDELPEVWGSMTHGDTSRIVKWLKNTWTITRKNETERNRLRRMLFYARKAHPSNQWMQERDDG